MARRRDLDTDIDSHGGLHPRCAERLAFVLLAVLAIALLLMPPIPQPQQYHRLSDMRSLVLGAFVLPNAVDVLSSLPFTVVGLAGLACLDGRLPSAQRSALRVFFAGLALTGLGSVGYHLQPTDQSLVWDRLPMTVAFAGAVGAVAAERRGADAGLRWLLGWLALGLVSIAVWVVTGDLRLYGLSQFGGFAVVLLWLPLPAAPGALRLPWSVLLAAYVVAKGFEVFDREVWALTGGVVAGHALKHVAAALGVVPLVKGLRRRRP